MRKIISSRLWSILTIFLLLTNLMFGAVPAAIAAPSPTGATITTQLPDYPPGATVLMTGAGWAENEAVHIVVNADDGSWSLESSPDPTADVAGGFTYEFQLPNWFVASYTVSATGFTSGTATVTFTDLNVGTYDQCANDDNSVPPGTGYTAGDLGCQWINGNLQSNTAYYAEGDATVQRVWLTDFTPGPHTLTLQYGTTKGGKHAYDFLTTWNWSENWIIEADRCQGITGCVSAASTENALDIPQDPNVPDSFEPSAPGARQFVMRGATLTSATTPVIESGSYAGDSETIITVSFNVPSSGPMCTANGCSVVLWFGAHVSAQANWGLGLGAGSISGSPYHVALYRVDGASVGQRDNQMQSNVVSQIPNGTIVIVKDAVPNDAQDFSFNLNNNGTISQNFSLDDDADATLPNSQTFSVPPGTWTASELNIPSGWNLTNLTCSVSGTNGSTFLVSGANASITLRSGDTVTCTYTNTLSTGSLKLSKSLTGGPGGYTGPFTINYDCGTGFTGFVSVTAGSSQTVSGIPSGTSCTVSETLPTPPTGYSFGTPTFSPSATVTIGAGTTVEVTTNNTLTLDTGSLKILKTLSNPDGASVPASFTINYDCGTGFTGSVSVAAGGSPTVSGIPTGSTCTISEPALTPIPGYTWGTPVITGSPATIGKGTTVEVSVANSITRDLGSLVLAKSLTGGPSGYTGPFTINYDCGTGFTGSVTVAAGSSQTVSGIPTGTSCTVSETLPTPPTGYSFGTPTFSPSATVTIPAGSGSSVTVTTNNTLTRDTGSFKITKTTSNPDGATLPASFTGTYDCGTGYTGTWSVANNGSQTISGIPTGNTCTVVETAPAAIPGYTWAAATYTPSSIVISSKGGTFEIVVGNSITRDRGTLQVVKKVINDNGGTATVNAFGLNTSAGSLTFDSGTTSGTTTTYTSQTITVVTGTYTLKENAVYGYTAGTWSCTGAAGTVVPTFNDGSVQVGKDENVVCAIINNDQPGKIVIIKNAKPAQGSFAFTTTGTGYTGFTLTGATTNNGNVNTQTLNAGTYTVKETTQLAWFLTGIGGSTDPNTPYNCVVTGSGGSTGVGDLITATATINLKNGDTVTCTFENTGIGATRTQGFWATHSQLANIAWFGGSGYGHTFPGVAGTTGIGDKLLCGRPIDTLGKLMGGFWSDVSKKSTGAKRSALDQARMQLLQQLLAAELNASAFGSVPAGGSGQFAAWEAAYCGTNQTAIQNAQSQAATFNSAGDSTTFTPGTSADSKNARAISNYMWWDTLP